MANSRREAPVRKPVSTRCAKRLSVPHPVRAPSHAFQSRGFAIPLKLWRVARDYFAVFFIFDSSSRP
jgi:hypothetical protein